MKKMENYWQYLKTLRSQMNVSVEEHTSIATIQTMENRLNSANIKRYSTEEIVQGTKNFSNRINVGGGGSVFKGELDNQVVAVKRLFTSFSEELYLKELAIGMQLDHTNLIKLLGYSCFQDQKILVLEFMENCLYSKLYDRSSSPPLDWSSRIHIALGILEGLTYLHGLDPPIIHGDLKPPNVMLDGSCRPKIIDFGSAQYGPTGIRAFFTPHVLTPPNSGTTGYTDPYYPDRDRVSVYTDIYSFGVILLELLTGIPSYHFLIDKVSRTDELVQLADNRLEGRFPLDGMIASFRIAKQCISRIPQHRPRSAAISTQLKMVKNYC